MSCNFCPEIDVIEPCVSVLEFALVSPGILHPKIVRSWSSLLATDYPVVSKALLVDRGGVMLLPRFTSI